MADRGFDIEDDLCSIYYWECTLIFHLFYVESNSCPRKSLFQQDISPLRIHVECAMERIKNFHIFDRSILASLTDITDRIFFVCCVLSNFQPPLCS